MPTYSIPACAFPLRASFPSFRVACSGSPLPPFGASGSSDVGLLAGVPDWSRWDVVERGRRVVDAEVRIEGWIAAARRQVVRNLDILMVSLVGVLELD